MMSIKYRDGVLLATVLVAAFMGQFDFFVVNVAAPSIQEALGASDAQLEMVVGGYAFAYASALVTGGRLGDLYGQRRVYLCGLTLFGLSSLLCGAAGSAGLLVVARVAQGFAAAVMIPQVLACVNVFLPASRRGWAMAWYGVATGVGAIAGQVLGGWLVHIDLAGLGWRTVFLVNVPVVAATAVAALRVLPGFRREHAPALDVPAQGGLAIGMALILIPFVLGRQNDWPLWMWGGPILGGAVVWAVMRAEDRLEGRGGDPLLERSVLTEPSLVRGTVSSVLFMAYFAAFMFRLTILLQRGEGLDPLHAGLVFAPSGATFALSSLLLRSWVARDRPRAVRAGTATTVCGLAVAIVGLLTPGAPILACVVVAVCLTGLGNGLVLPTLIGVALSDVPTPKAGVASGIVTTAQQFAASAGVALLGTLYYSLAAQHGHRIAMALTLIVDVLLLLAVMAVAGRRRRG